MIRLNRIFGRKSAGDSAQAVDRAAETPAIEDPAIEDPTFALRLRQAVATDGGGGPDEIGTATARPAAVTAERSEIRPLRPSVEEDWDEELADDDLTRQERAFARPTLPVAEGPELRGPRQAGFGSTPETLAEQPTLALTSEQRAAMAQRQLTAAQTARPSTPEPTIAVDLSHTDLPDIGRKGPRAGRVKTRLLGFGAAPGLTHDPIETAGQVVPTHQGRFPAGWIVVVHGPGQGEFFPVFNGVSQIGRGEDQAIRLDFGDSSISRSNHAAIAYDDEQNGFFLGHGGKTNIIRLNDKPVLSTESLNHQDRIRIGETTLLFVALCDASFRWDIGSVGQDDGG